MPTLFQEKAGASPAALTSQMLRSRHRWERYHGVLLALAVGLALTLAMLIAVHLVWAQGETWKVAAAIWAGGVLLTLAALPVAWWFAPDSLADTAQMMDRHLAAKNRLETAAGWQASESPLARAQREETAACSVENKGPGAGP